MARWSKQCFAEMRVSCSLTRSFWSLEHIESTEKILIKFADWANQINYQPFRGQLYDDNSTFGIHIVGK